MLGELGLSCFEFGEFLVAAVVAGFVDEAFGFGEIAFGEVVVGEEEAHAGTGGDAEHFFEIVVGAAGEKGEGQIEELPCPSEEFDGLVEVTNRFGGAGWMGPAERKVIEADGKEQSVLFSPLHGLGGPTQDLRALAATEEDVAVEIAPK